MRWDEDSSYIHRLQAEDYDAVDGSTSDLRSLCTRAGVRGRGLEEDTLVGAIGVMGEGY